MEKAIEIVRAAEASREQIRNMKYDTATINFVKDNQNKPKIQYNCKKCGRKHKPLECPAFGKICAKCKKKSHFAAKCFQNTKNIQEMNVPKNELVYIDSVNENETKWAMKNSIDSNFKNVEMVSETTRNDLPSAMEFSKNRKDFFKDLRLNTALNEMLCDAREFPGEIDIPANFELTQPRHRARRRNVNFNYEAREDLIEDPTLKYKAEFYFFTLDKAINALESRFHFISTHSNYFQFLYNICDLKDTLKMTN
ncbi:uncharacterized protein TNCV_612061 [Trichonephila clavipes]|nr:uncharacterized protein TNCV_612061 [Trichonephila clavipes]